MPRNGLDDICETVTQANAACRHTWPEGQHRHAFARVVRAGRGGVAAVVGGEDSEIAGAERGFDEWQHGVEVLEGVRIARHIPAMAEQHVEIDEVDEGEAAIR